MPDATLSSFAGVRANRNTDDRMPRHRAIIKAAAYPVAMLLAVLLLGAALPPIVADQSDRAILDAPVTLITTPIPGEVSATYGAAGAHPKANAPLAEVTNGRVDQTTLMTLQGRAVGLREAWETAHGEKLVDQHYLAVLDDEIAREKARLIQEYNDKVTALKAEAASKQAAFAEKKAIHERQRTLLKHGDVSEGMLKPVTQQMQAAASVHESAAAKLAALTAQLTAIHNNVFVGDDLMGIATLAQKRRDVALDAARKGIEETQTKAAFDDAQRLVDEETARVTSLHKATLRAPGQDEILHVSVAPGRFVNAGDSLATLVNCKNLFAVAIFSYRKASSLSVGTRVKISGEGISQPVSGIVQDVVPKSNEKTDDLYAVSFPQTERREMYVVIKPDNIAALRPHNKADQPSGSCPVGKWVTVSRADGWIPASSVLWHDISRFFRHTTAALIAPLGLHAASADHVK